MPRVLGLETTQRRRRHSRGGLDGDDGDDFGFGAPRSRQPHNSKGPPDDMEFRGTQTQREHEILQSKTDEVQRNGGPSSAQRSTVDCDTVDDRHIHKDLDPDPLANDGDSETTMGDVCDDESMDLLSAACDEGEDQPQSPVSPATQTLNRLSKLGSQEGGAELCIRLLNKSHEVEGAKPEIKPPTDDRSPSSSNKRKQPNTTSQPLHWDNGRPNTRLQHEQGCVRGDIVANKRQRKGPTSDGNRPEDELPTWTVKDNVDGKSSQTGDRTNFTPGVSRQVDPMSSEVQISTKSSAPFEVGTVVAVQDRQWPGQNKAGGVARIVAAHLDGDDEEVTYDVKYVLESRRELGVEATYVSLHTDYESPSKGITNSVGGSDDDSTEGMSSSSPPKFDKDGHPLSEYERQRLKNIQRNETRLKQLGLLVAPTQVVERTRGAKKKQKRQLAPSDTDRRIQPKRHKTDKEMDIEVFEFYADHGKGPLIYRCVKGRQKDSFRGAQDMKDAGVTGSLTMSTIINYSTPGNYPKSGKPWNDIGGKGLQIRTSKGRFEDSDMGWVETSVAAKSEFVSSLAKCSLEEAAKVCSKCRLEHEGQKNPSLSHDDGCPRKTKHRGSKKAATLNTVAKSNTQEELRLPDPTTTSKSKRPQVPKTSCAKRDEPTSDRSHTPVRGGQRVVESKVRASTTQPASFSTNRRVQAKKTQSASTQPPTQSKPRTPPLPGWIKEFIAEANGGRDDIPAPRGSKWIPCPNPWGKVGHEEGDIVIFSPFQSESTGDLLSIHHQGPDGTIPKRFVANPFEESSPYLETHRSPDRGGYSVLRLTRDRVGLRPWGFTVRLHEFGGACLVQDVEPLSPAEAAEDISGWSKDNPGLKIHDMIVCINGKTVSNMTMPELQLEFDVCGSEMLIVLARFDIKETHRAHDITTLEDLAMDWNDIGAGTSSSKKKERGSKRVSFEEADSRPYYASNTSSFSCQSSMLSPVRATEGMRGDWKKPRSKTSEKTVAGDYKLPDKQMQTRHVESPPKAVWTKPVASSKRKRDCLPGDISTDSDIDEEEDEVAKKVCKFVLSQADSDDDDDRKEKFRGEMKWLPRKTRKATEDESSVEQEYGGDGTPWMGCVCGKTHPAPIKVFWIQCDCCDTWYNAAEDCLGFDDKTAEQMDSWHCWKCRPPIPGFSQA
mmetsp:Transcript_7356/g.17113  ORF Transcript_7356/g.17113 Transcript_7356/m.17113 type:complete len:1167 (+) Transcript_7356:119-3619(+)